MGKTCKVFPGRADMNTSMDSNLIAIMNHFILLFNTQRKICFWGISVLGIGIQIYVFWYVFWIGGKEDTSRRSKAK